MTPCIGLARGGVVFAVHARDSRMDLLSSAVAYQFRVPLDEFAPVRPQPPPASLLSSSQSIFVPRSGTSDNGSESFSWHMRKPEGLQASLAATTDCAGGAAFVDTHDVALWEIFESYWLDVMMDRSRTWNTCACVACAGDSLRPDLGPDCPYRRVCFRDVGAASGECGCGPIIM
ncbi:hypothetical protein EDB85DRAFT_1971432 [Lactarius pseudohatsudake]|nr:hypothetical protein EDB85DRAFT_1971432 [Lactarius pseudohatsudake]